MGTGLERPSAHLLDAVADRCQLVRKVLATGIGGVEAVKHKQDKRKT